MWISTILEHNLENMEVDRQNIEKNDKQNLSL